MNEIINIPPVHDTLLDTGTGSPGDGVDTRFARFTGSRTQADGRRWWIVNNNVDATPVPGIIHGTVRVSAASCEPAVTTPICRTWECHFVLVYPADPDNDLPYHRFSDFAEVGPNTGPAEDTPPTMDLSEFDTGLVYVTPGRWIGEQTRWFATVTAVGIQAPDVTGASGD